MCVFEILQFQFLPYIAYIYIFYFEYVPSVSFIISFDDMLFVTELFFSVLCCLKLLIYCIQIIQPSNKKYFNSTFKNLNCILCHFLSGIQFQIQRMEANDSSDASFASNPYRDNNIGVEKLLELNSEEFHDDVCLAYIFTYRDFADGVLGLAWVGEKGNWNLQSCNIHVIIWLN